MKSLKSLKLIRDYGFERAAAVAQLVGNGEVNDIRKAIDIVRVGAWFEIVRAQLGQASAYGVGKRVQPHTYTPRRGGRWPQHHNLWAKYAQGKHLPSRRTLREASLAAPGSGEILNAAAWEALDVSRPLGARGDELLSQLRFGVQQAVFDPRLLNAGLRRRQESLDQTLVMLERRADLDGVTALVILLRESHEAGHDASALIVGNALHNALLTAISSTLLWRSALELLALFAAVILPLARDEQIAFDLDIEELYEQHVYLSAIHVALEDSGRVMDLMGCTDSYFEILHGRFGYDHLMGLSPKLRLRQPPDRSSEKAKRRVTASRAYREWALDVLRSGRHERLPPEDDANRLAGATPSDPG